jgi:hypothetical protein
MFIACICGGILEALAAIGLGLGALFVFLKKLCKRRGCGCECHEKEKQQ